MSDLEFNQRWVCPVCGGEVLAGDPATLDPPTCNFGHPPTEMEQALLKSESEGT